MAKSKNKSKTASAQAHKSVQAQNKARAVYLKKQKLKQQKTILVAIISILVIAIIGLVTYFIVQSSISNKAITDSIAGATDSTGLIDPGPDATLSYKSATKLKHPSIASDNGTIAISSGKVVDPDTAGLTTVEHIFDPICVACYQVEKVLGEKLTNAADSGKIAYLIHPVGAFDGNSANSTEPEYSSRAAAAVVSAAEQDPSKVLTFIETIYKEGNWPFESNYSDTASVRSDNDIKKWAIDAGYTEAQATIIVNREYQDWIKKVTEGVKSDYNYLHESSNGISFSTPEILLNGRYLTLNNDGLTELYSKLS
jgi:protein-disulfide isomerase